MTDVSENRDAKLLKELVQLARDNSTYRILGYCVSGFATLAILYLLIASPVYLATCEVMITTEKSDTFFQSFGGLVKLSERSVYSELEVLKSPRVAGLAVKQLGLKKLLPALAGDDKTSAEEKHQIATLAVLDSLDAKLIGLSNVVEVSVRWSDPTTAMELANAIVNLYLADQIDKSRSASIKGRDWLQDRIAQIRVDLLDASDKLRQAQTAIGKNSEVAQLEAEVATYQKIYQSYLQAYSDYLQRQLFPTANATIVSEATKPMHKIAPKGKLLVALAVLAGLLVGTAIVLLAHFQPFKNLLSEAE